jgi:dienelactone hydrolase
VATRQTPQAAGVTATELRVPADGVYGRVSRPKDNSTRKPALLVFGGSEGGLRPAVVLKAALLAAHGYPTLALAYWKAPGLPQNLSRIPLEYFRKALAVLRAQPGVDPSHVLVTGASWGGEGSLLVAATYPDLVHGVIAEAPNSYVDATPFSGNGSSWTLNGRDLDDITFRLRGRRDLTVLRYPQAGHFVGAIQPYTPITGALLTHAGGDLAATQAANADVHAKLLALLAAH